MIRRHLPTLRVAAGLILVGALIRPSAAAGQDAVRPPDAATREKCILDEVSVGSGYVAGNLRRNPIDLEMVPVFVRFGFNVNGFLRLDSRRHTVQVAFEPFADRTFEPGVTGSAGWDLFLRYLQTLTGRVDVYFEIGGGPVYWGLATYEQGRAGWNFLDQIGAGYRVALAGQHAVSFGYRWVHVSRAGLDTRSRADKGINANGFVVAYTWRPKAQRASLAR